MPSQIVEKCSRAISEKQWNISFAESMTAGRMCAEFALTENSGDVLRGGIVCYEVYVKEQLLKVPHSVIKEFTPESAEVTQLLATEAAKIFKTKITVAVTGLAGPGGSETIEKPIGTVFFHIISPVGTFKHREVFDGPPEEVILQAIDKVAELLIAHLEGTL